MFTHTYQNANLCVFLCVSRDLPPGRVWVQTSWRQEVLLMLHLNIFSKHYTTSYYIAFTWLLPEGVSLPNATYQLRGKLFLKVKFFCNINITIHLSLRFFCVDSSKYLGNISILEAGALVVNILQLSIDVLRQLFSYQLHLYHKNSQTHEASLFYLLVLLRSRQFFILTNNTKVMDIEDYSNGCLSVEFRHLVIQFIYYQNMWPLTISVGLKTIYPVSLFETFKSHYFRKLTLFLRYIICWQ